MLNAFVLSSFFFLDDREWLLVEIHWISPLGYVALWSTRQQNSNRIVYCHVTSDECREVPNYVDDLKLE